MSTRAISITLLLFVLLSSVQAGHRKDAEIVASGHRKDAEIIISGPRKDAEIVVSGQTAETQSKAVILTIDGEVTTPLKLTAADLAKLPRRSVSAKGHAEKESTFEGVELGEILKLAGVKLGEQMRGKELGLYLVVGAADNYRAIFALPELDHGFTDRIVILADRRDGKPLSEREGPIRIVVPDEKREGRWVRQVTTFTIRRAP